MRGKINRLDILKTLNRNRKAMILDQKSETKELEQVTKDLEKSEYEHKRLFAELEFCPLCKKELNHEHNIS